MDSSQIDTLFQSVDKNGDGKVSLKELEELFVTLNMKLNTKDLKLIYKKHDKNGDRLEFRSLIAELFKANKVYLEAYNAFQVFDSDKDGRISEKELRTVTKQLGKKMTSKEAQELMKSMGTDRSGNISFDEFAKAYAIGACSW